MNIQLRQVAGDKLGELHKRLHDMTERYLQSYASGLVLTDSPSDLVVAKMSRDLSIQMPVPTGWKEWHFGNVHLSIESPAELSWQPGALEKLVAMDGSQTARDLLADCMKFYGMYMKLCAWIEQERQRGPRGRKLSDRQLVTTYPELSPLFQYGAYTTRRVKKAKVRPQTPPEEIQRILAMEHLLGGGA